MSKIAGVGLKPTTSSHKAAVDADLDTLADAHSYVDDRRPAEEPPPQWAPSRPAVGITPTALRTPSWSRHWLGGAGPADSASEARWLRHARSVACVSGGAQTVRHHPAGWVRGSATTRLPPGSTS